MLLLFPDLHAAQTNPVSTLDYPAGFQQNGSSL